LPAEILALRNVPWRLLAKECVKPSTKYVKPSTPDNIDMIPNNTTRRLEKD